MSENLMTIPLRQLKRAALNVRKTARKARLGHGRLLVWTRLALCLV